jgi:hypothetical protein
MTIARTKTKQCMFRGTIEQDGKTYRVSSYKRRVQVSDAGRIAGEALIASGVEWNPDTVEAAAIASLNHPTYPAMIFITQGD